MKFSRHTDVGLVRVDNEDALGLYPLDEAQGVYLLVVADGMGGRNAGEVASSLAVETLHAVVSANWLTWPVGTGVLDGLRAAAEAVNRAVLQAQRQPGLDGMGTTMTAALIWGSAVYLVHVGDTRAYLFRGVDGRQLTDDHSVVGELVRNGELTEAQAMYHPQRHIITQALGTEARTAPDGVGIGWQPGDVLLLCTDGLSGLVTREEMAAVVQEPPFETLAQRLVSLALERGGHDNVSVLAARWEV